MKAKKFILLSLIVTSILFAQDENQTQEQIQSQNIAKSKLDYESYKNTGRSNYDSRAYETTNLIDLENQKRDDGQFNYSEIVYEHLKAYQRMPRENGQGVNVSQEMPAHYNFHNTTLLAAQAKQEVVAKNQAIKAQQEIQPDIQFVQGYCFLKNETTIERVAGYANLSCDFMDQGHGTLAVSLTPDFFSQALIATPLYLTLDSNNKRLIVQQGVVLNGARTSINVASQVNDYLIQKIVAASAITTSATVTKYAQEYLDELKQSREKQEGGNIYYDNNGNLVQSQTTTNHEKPNKADYITGAAIELVSSLVNVVGNAYLDRLTYTFKVNKDTMLFADLQVDFNKKGMRGLNFAPSNMILNNEPRFEPSLGGIYNSSTQRQRGSNQDLVVPLDTDTQGIQTQDLATRQTYDATQSTNQIGQQIIMPQQQQIQLQPNQRNNRIIDNRVGR
ncbi:hypothetical protein [Campylobacter sp. JMF_03 NE3]|uniref:hypothetical protein n=1 Tax=Campylobacter sp. JMF_03 NE3 TaxID=2983831 RepID=UPI0022E99DC7|nr:hypothetical protein [Campylobacter sp. JMF_03 NE3]MDA3053530.1 hypothetical protein [Campylobacter sp. JMF_03 NE3]